ncbi:hypothetical protein NQ318_009042 [Aromia moschata]|uniref:Uncharacterized protein n=1 Tax=Aromia moschata TaxID=1265417 RepID=A0AAV8YUJ4_9CUCU|nr:hypothetical protein NQ318_009042 [Aromia moschata]
MARFNEGVEMIEDVNVDPEWTLLHYLRNKLVVHRRETELRIIQLVYAYTYRICTMEVECSQRVKLVIGHLVIFCPTLLLSTNSRTGPLHTFSPYNNETPAVAVNWSISALKTIFLS